MVAQKARCEQAGEDPEVEAWLEAVNASAIFSHNVFGPGVTEGAGATDWLREEARGAPGVSISPSRRMSRSLGGGGSVLQPQLCRAPCCIHDCSCGSWGAQPGAEVCEMP